MSDARIQKEFQTISSQKEFRVWLVNNDFRHWKAVIGGPNDSVYDGGQFQIDIKIPNSYPFQPPKIQFDTKIWHTNISSRTGDISLNILNND